MRAVLHGLAMVLGFRGLYLACRVFGTLEYLINYKRRRRTRRMIRKVLGADATTATLRHYVRSHFMRERADKVFYLIFDLLPPERLAERFTIVGREVLNEGLARGKGIYSLLCHHGAHHVTGMCMSLLGHRVGAIRDPHEGAMRMYVQQLWENRYPDAPKPRVLYSGDFARQIYRLFQDNWGLGSSLDVARMRDARLKTLPVQIFGETRNFLTGTLQIALRCKAFVVQSFIVSEPDFRYRLEILGPMTDPETSTDNPALLQEILQRYADNIAAFARQHPDHVTRL
jgi:lauroyl/myristoyl acyltransferase